MLDDRRGFASVNANGFVLAALLASAGAVYLLSQAFPVASHAGDWPGPGVGAAISLELGGAAAFVGMILAAIAWRPPRPSRPSWLVLIGSLGVYLAAGVCLWPVGLDPFCGGAGPALGAAPARTSLLHDLFGSTCGLCVLAQYLVPLSAFVAVMLWRARRGLRRASPAA